MTRTYIIDPTNERGQTLGLMPWINYFKTRLVKDGPWVGVKTVVHEPRNELGEIDGDCAYCVWIAGNEVPWDRWKSMTLIGEQVTESEYNYVLKALEWGKVNLGHDERKPVDMMAMPPVGPPLSFEPESQSVTLLPGVVVTGIDKEGNILLADTPAASALADAILTPIDVECKE